MKRAASASVESDAGSSQHLAAASPMSDAEKKLASEDSYMPQKTIGRLHSSPCMHRLH